MVGFMLTGMMALACLFVDSAYFTLGSTRLQLAADAAAQAAAFALPNSTFQAATSANQIAALKAIVLYEASVSAGRAPGTLTLTPTITYDTVSYSQVTVTLTSKPPTFFAGTLNKGSPILSATATASFAAPPTCLLALGPTGIDIMVDNSGSVIDSRCAVFSNSTNNPSIYLNSGTISGTSIGASGTIVQSNSGSNSMIPASPNQNRPPLPDPRAVQVVPTGGACAVTNANYSGGGVTYNLTPQTYCGATVFGGNGSTINFAAGVYYFTGDVTFNNTSPTFASGITLVMTGAAPGNLNYTNYAVTTTPLTAPTTGATAGIAIWQACNTPGSQTASFQGGSTLLVTGSIYLPCANVDVGNNAQLSSSTNVTFDMTVNQIYVHGSGGVHTNNPVSSGGSVSSPTLSQ